jgi:hypothetical protein
MGSIYVRGMHILGISTFPLGTCIGKHSRFDENNRSGCAFGWGGEGPYLFALRLHPIVGVQKADRVIVAVERNQPMEHEQLNQRCHGTSNDKFGYIGRATLAIMPVAVSAGIMGRGGSCGASIAADYIWLQTGEDGNCPQGLDLYSCIRWKLPHTAVLVGAEANGALAEKVYNGATHQLVLLVRYLAMNPV